jgi:hypothetical protein
VDKIPSEKLIVYSYFVPVNAVSVSWLCNPRGVNFEDHL